RCPAALFVSSCFNSPFLFFFFFFSSRRRHTRSKRDWSSDVCSSDLAQQPHQCCTQCLFCLADSSVLASLLKSIVNHRQTPLFLRSEERRVGKERRSGTRRDEYGDDEQGDAKTRTRSSTRDQQREHHS